MIPHTLAMTDASQMFDGWTISGPIHKRADQYLSRDGDNPFVPWPRYGWPLRTECWYFLLDGHGWLLIATGHTVEAAFNRAMYLALSRRDP